MKKYSLLSLILMVSSMLSYAEQNKTEYIHHVVVNNCVSHVGATKITYELTGPSGVISKGSSYPGTETFNMDFTAYPNLSGIYVLRYHVCPGSLVFPDCRSYSGSVNIQHNAEVLWELSLDGIKVTETNI